MPEMKSCAYCGPLADHTTMQCPQPFERKVEQIRHVSTTRCESPHSFEKVANFGGAPSHEYAELEGEVVGRIDSTSKPLTEKVVPKNAAQFPHYFKSVEGLTHIDAYRVIDLWEITDPCIQHALKKLLAAGKRGAKDAHKDVGEAIASLERWQEMRLEETTHVKIESTSIDNIGL